MPVVVSVRTGLPHLLAAPSWAKRPRWRSAYVKGERQGPVHLGRTNLEGDRQGDRRVHGGPERAVLCYSEDHYPAWRSELGLEEMGPGAFGENFTVRGATELDVCVGDVYEVGLALVQVSQPRGPCYKISYRWGRQDLLRRVELSGRHGWYLRVVSEGEVAAGLEMALRARPHPEWTVRRAADVMSRRRRDPEAAAALARCEALSAGWAEALGRAAAGRSTPA